MRAAIYLRVSTAEQSTDNQERELRAAAERMGHEVVEVYRDHGISGSKGKDQATTVRPAAPRRHAPPFRSGHVLERRSARSIAATPVRLPIRVARAADRPVPASARARHHDAGRESHVLNARRVRRVRALDHPRAGVFGHGAGQGARNQERQGDRAALDPCPTRDAIRAEHGKGGVSLRVVARRHHVGVETVRRCLAERAAQAVNDRACVVAPEDRREFITSVLMAIAGLIACGIVVLIASLIVSVLF